jgi:hypothetical protein
MPFEQCLPRTAVLASCTVLIASVAGAPSASATPVEKTTGSAAAAVKPVPAHSNAAPSLPSAVPPTTPPAPVATPAAPRTRAAPHVPVKPPPEAKPTPSPPSTSPGGDEPAGSRMTGATDNAIGSVASTGKETTQQAVPSARNGGGRTSTSQSGPDGGATRSRAIDTASSAPPSIRAAEVAVLQRWFARIWPAVSLGGGSGKADRGWVARVVVGELFRPVAAAVAQALYLASSSTPPVGNSPVGNSPFAGHPGAANAPRPAVPDAPAAVDGEKIIYLVVLTALLALLAFTIWREFRSALHPHVR